jgi:cyclic-di-GMP phosphodiesterase TipF (flagellum assembly factor)
MTQHNGIRDAAHAHPHYSDAFVIFSVTVLSLACGAWLVAQIGVSLSWATIGALSVYSILLAIHLLVRRAVGESGGEMRPSEREQEDGGWLSSSPALANPSPIELPQHAAPAFDSSGFGRELSARRAAVRESTVRELENALPLPAPHPAEPFNYRPARPPALSEVDAATRQAATLERNPERSRAAEPEAAPVTGSPSEANVEIIQDLIKKLADELNTPNGPPALDPTAASGAEYDAVGMVGRSVAALETTARTMRSSAADQTRAAPTAASKSAEPWRPPLAKPAAAMPAGSRPPPPALNPQLTRVADAVSADQMDVLLEPIHALPEGRTRHFEVAVRLLAADGMVLEQAEFARAARGSGLMPRIDAAKIIRAARVARRLGERGREGSVLTAIAGESLTDKSFVNAAASQRGTDGRMNLVLCFTQGDVRTFTPAHAAALGSLSTAGFGFALEEVSDLDMDFAAIAGMGFAFVKLDAPAFLEGLAVPGGRIPSSDICRYLADFGLTLIVGRIEDDWLLARILGFGVLFGKGALFGGPKLVKADVFHGSAAA